MVCGTDRISCYLFLNRYIQDSKRQIFECRFLKVVLVGRRCLRLLKLLLRFYLFICICEKCLQNVLL